MASSRMNGGALTSAAVEIIDYDDLIAPELSLNEKILFAFGADGLGILFVRGVPGYLDARSHLLPLAKKFSALDVAVQEKYVHSASCFSFGWSHGKEKLQGRPDLSKGSFYANPQYDRPVDDEDIIGSYPTFVHPNIWPNDDLPEMEPAFKALGQMIVSTGLEVARHCDNYVKSICPAYENDSDQPCEHPAEQSSSGSTTDQEFSSWCGWHNDHGSLTGLTAAMLLDKDGHVVTDPDPLSGLYIRNRMSQLVKILIPPDCIAFQIGETAQIHSGGILQATPHAVRGSKLACMRGVTRETFAVFMEPMWYCQMSAPRGCNPLDAQTQEASRNLPKGVPSISSRWTPSQDFGEFTMKSLGAYY